MKDFVERIIKEHKELRNKVNNLSNFVDNNFNSLNKEEYSLMRLQLNAMINYLTYLEQRLKIYNIYITPNGEYLEKLNIK